jgi:ornithine--oxo-acid transaminase
VAERLLRAGLLTRETHHNTIRLAPPLIISKADIDWAVDRIAEVLAALSKEVAEPMPVA